MTDPYASAVVLLLPFVIGDDSNRPIDKSSYGRSFSSGGMSLSTSQYKWGGASGRFTGEVQAAMTGATVGSSDFTVEAWFKLDANSTGSQFILATGNAGGRGWDIGINNSSCFFQFSTNGSYQPENSIVGSSRDVAAGVWNHIAFVRHGNMLSLYLNGTLNLSKAHTGVIFDANTIRIGNIDFGSQFIGYMDDIRVTYGVARYTANFTPPEGFSAEAPIVVVYKVLQHSFCGYKTPVNFNLSAKVTELMPPILDAIYGGRGVISGAVSEKGTPDHAVSRIVRLHRKIDGALVRTTWSDNSGQYLFKGVAIEPYYVVSHDHSGNFNAVIKDSIVPEVMV